MNEIVDADNIDCHLQQIGMGTLICKAAKQSGDHFTNEVDPEDCVRCHAGIIYRKIGCDSVLPKLRIFQYGDSKNVEIENLFCKIRKRNTTVDYCETCTIKAAKTTKEIITETNSLFEKEEFFTSFKDLEKARIAMRDGKYETAITYSITMLESTIKIIHEKMGSSLPDKLAVSELYKSIRSLLRLSDIDIEGSVSSLANNINGCINSIGFLRNSLSDAHGKGTNPQQVDSYIAELGVNTCSSMATFLIRRYMYLKESI